MCLNLIILRRSLEESLDLYLPGIKLIFYKGIHSKKSDLLKIGNLEIEGQPLLLAPMEDLTDPPFRYICKQYGADLMYTEFISSDGLIRDGAKSVRKLEIFEYEIHMSMMGNIMHTLYYIVRHTASDCKMASFTRDMII